MSTVPRSAVPCSRQLPRSLLKELLLLVSMSNTLMRSAIDSIFATPTAYCLLPTP
ncbi:MAG: hypothetical protein F6J90_01890 [Moorea sp. SIOASIH]|nr:hypothetical protein [Moorena sp. SIOASIH]